MNEVETQREIFSWHILDWEESAYEVAYSAPWGDTYPETRTTPAIDGSQGFSGSAVPVRSLFAWISRMARSSGKWTVAISMDGRIKQLGNLRVSFGIVMIR